MTRRANRGKVLPPTFPLFPPRLEIPQKTRDYHIPAATTTPGSQSPQKTKPAQIAGLFTFWWRTLFPRCLSLVKEILVSTVEVIGLEVKHSMAVPLQQCKMRYSQ